MNKSERDKFDDIVSSKLLDYEINAEPSDWDAIAGRLPSRNNVVLMYWRRYAAAAVVVFALMSGAYFLLQRDDTGNVVENTAVSEENNAGNSSLLAENATEETATQSAQTAAKPVKPTKTAQTTISVNAADIAENEPLIDEQPETPSLAENNAPVHNAEQTDNEITILSETSLNADTPLLAEASPTHKQRRWSFGAGGGSYSVGNTSADAGVMSMDYMSEAMIGPKEMADDANLQYVTSHRNAVIKQNVRHHRPLSLGVGVGYALNNRWTLQSGLVYTLLRSEWDELSITTGKALQQLHFVGIPLGVNYKIAEWNRFRVYAAAGAMADINVAGNIRTKYYDETGINIDTKTENVRINKPQLSVNGRVGVSYPLFRFVSAYAESGAEYYFQTKNSVETIRSDKPFQLSLQAGIRLGF
ncbi:MAG: PorT family protein [Tannerella sp.]|jgi:hypothetical protein|nr:PorT family protein [Tannerella sp.]